MAIVKHYTKRDVQDFFDEFKKEKSEKTKSDISIELMDAYVAMFQPADIDEWIATCLSFSNVELNDKNGNPLKDDKGNVKERKDIASIREHFLQKYFFDKSEAGIRAAKSRKEAEKERKKADKKAFDNMTPEEKFRYKMQQYAKEANETDTESENTAE